MNNRNENRKLNLSGYFLHNIPMTVEGDDFIRQLRGYMNTDRWELGYKFNGPRTESALSEGLPPRAFDQSLPKRFATGRRMYIHDKVRRQGSSAHLYAVEEAFEKGRKWGQSLGDHNDNLTLKRTIENHERDLVAAGNVIRNQDLTMRELNKRIEVMAIDHRDMDNSQQDCHDSGYAEGHADGLEKGADIIEKLEQENRSGLSPQMTEILITIKAGGRTVTIK